MFCIRFATFLFDRYFKSLAPMLRRYPPSIGVIPGIDRAISLSTHPPYFYGMLGLFVPPALPTHGILMTPLVVLAGFLICLVQWPSTCIRWPCTSFPMSASRYPASRMQKHLWYILNALTKFHIIYCDCGCHGMCEVLEIYSKMSGPMGGKFSKFANS